MLSINSLSVRYAGVHAVQEVTLAIAESSVTAILGANGAGKTSLLRSIMGLAPRSTGSVTFKSRDVTRVPTHRLVRMGMVLVPEGRQILRTMTVAENLEVASYASPQSPAERRSALDEVWDRFPRLSERRRQLAGTLSGGEQQMLAIGRALVVRPTLLLLDEPSLGLAPLIVEDLASLIRQLANDMTILLVEQNAWMPFEVAQYAYVLQVGRLIASGTPAELRDSEAIHRAYLGG